VKPARWTDEDRARLAVMWHQGLSYAAIGAALNRTAGAVAVQIHYLRTAPGDLGPPALPRRTGRAQPTAGARAVIDAFLRKPCTPR